MQAIADAVIGCDVLVLATPIYTWYCTPPMKAVLDRFYGMNKYYGSAPQQRLWERTRITIVATCGYDIPYGTEPFETGVRRLCEHSRIPYLGMLAERDLDDQASFHTPAAVAASRAFAQHVLDACRVEGTFASPSDNAWETPNQGYPILEYDSDPSGLIHAPDHRQPIELPERCVITFFKEVVDALSAG